MTDNTLRTISCKISILSFLATVMVMYRHSLNYLAFFGEYYHKGYSADVQDTVWMFTEMAVPFFFIVSGYFFFRNDYYSAGNYVEMLKKKWRTLVVPFLFWNILSIPLVMFGGEGGDGAGVVDMLQKIALSYYYGPLWYVRDLIIMMVLVPLYYWIFKINNVWLYLALVVATFLMWHPYEYRLLATVGLFAFPLGGVLSRYPQLVEWKANKMLTVAFGVAWIVLFALPKYDINFPYRYCLMILSSIVFAWNAVNYLPDAWCERLKRLAPYSFFLYVTHYYVIKLIKKVLGHAFFGNEIMSLLVYIALPIVSCVIIIAIAKLMNRYVPTIYSLITGGRTSEVKR